MNGVPMDTLSIAKSLQEACFKAEKAEPIAQWFSGYSNIATKDFVHNEISKLSARMMITAIALTSVIIAAFSYLK